jgi:hypothetical protein
MVGGKGTHLFGVGVVPFSERAFISTLLTRSAYVTTTWASPIVPEKMRAFPAHRDPKFTTPDVANLDAILL